MFNFTTTTVINSNFDLNNMALWSLNEDAKGEVSFNVKRVLDFKDKNVAHIYKRAGYLGTKEEVEIDFTNLPNTIKEGDTMRLNFVIAPNSDSQLSAYANSYWYKGKSFTVEFPVKATIVDTVKNLAKIIKKYGLLVYGERLADVAYAGNKLTIKAVSEFQHFPVELFKVEVLQEGSASVYQIKFVNVPEVTVSTVAVGKSSFADYGWIIRNLRLPTEPNTDFFSVNKNEMPIMGGLYNQYTIEYVTDRDQMGLNAVGEITKSKTTHVFYVLSSLIGNAVDTTNGFDPSGNFSTETDFELALKKLVDTDATRFEEIN